jgi:hypothetical protein
MSASSLSSRPLPNPSRSHSPPISSASSMAMLSRVVLRPSITPLTLSAWFCDWAKPVTEGKWGGGSAAVAALVRLDSGCVKTGVEASKSVYDMNESRLEAPDGEGGWLADIGLATALAGESPRGGKDVRASGSVCVNGEACSRIGILGDEVDDLCSSPGVLGPGEDVKE